MRIFLWISSLIALVFAVVLTFFPLQFLNWLKFGTEGFTLFLARDYATAMLAFAVGLWMVRNESDSRSLKILLMMWCIFNLAEVVVNLAAIIAGTLEAKSKAAAIPFSLHIIFAFGAGYFLLRKRIEKI